MEKVTWEKALQLFETNNNYFVAFTTPWCGDCKMMKFMLKNVEKNFADKNIKFIEIDVEEAQIFRQKTHGFEILKVPSFYTVVNNVKNFIGYEYVPIPFIEDAIRKVVK